MKILEDLIDLEEELSFEEERLFRLIEDRVFESISYICADHFLDKMQREIMANEYQLVEEKVMPEMIKKLLLVAPFRMSQIKDIEYCDKPYGVLANPFSGPYFENFEVNMQEWNKTKRSWKWAWIPISFDYFVNNGFSRDFAKRIVEKFETSNRILRKRSVPGYVFTVSNICNYRAKIQLTDALEYALESVLKNKPHKAKLIDHIYKSFSQGEINDSFINIVNELFDSEKDRMLADG